MFSSSGRNISKNEHYSASGIYTHGQTPSTTTIPHPTTIFFSALNKPNSLRISSYVRCSLPHLHGPLLHLLWYLHVFPVLGVQNWTQQSTASPVLSARAGHPYKQRVKKKCRRPAWLNKARENAGPLLNRWGHGDTGHGKGLRY